MRKLINQLGIIFACLIIVAYIFRPSPQQVFNVGKKLAEYQVFDRFRCSLAIQTYKLAILMDSSYVQPYYEVSDNLVSLAYRGLDSRGRDVYDNLILAKAGAYLTKAEILAPNAGELHKCRAYLLKAYGDLEEAAKEAEIAVSMEPDNYRFHKMYGVVLLERYYDSNSRYFASQAIKEFQLALDNNPTDRQRGSILDFLGLTYMDAFRQNQEAARCFEASLKVRPDSWVTLHHYNEVKESVDTSEDLRHNNFAKAVDNFKTSNNLNSLYNTAKEYLSYRDYQQAEEIFKQIVAKEPKNYEAFNLLGFTYMEEGELDKALEAFNKTIRINPKYAEAYRHISSIKHLQKDIPASIQYCLKAVALNNKDAIGYYNLATYYNNIGDRQKAEEYYRKAIEVDPKYDLAYYALGILISKQDRLAGIPYFQKAVDLDTSFDYCYVFLANLYSRQNQHEKSQQVLEKALSKGKVLGAVGLNGLAWSYVCLNINQEEAVSLALLARHMAPEMVEIVDTLSKAYVNLGRMYLEQSYYFQALSAYFMAGYVWVDSFFNGFLFVFILIALILYLPRLLFRYSIKEDGVYFTFLGSVSLNKVLFKDIEEIRVLKIFEEFKYVFHRNWRNRLIGKKVLIRTKEGYVREIILTPGKPVKFVETVKSKITIVPTPVDILDDKL